MTYREETARSAQARARESGLNHATLCARAVRWLLGLKGQRRCVVAFSELTTVTMDCEPDAIGWTPRGLCLFVECKVSRSDFLKDAKKQTHVSGAVPGQLRFYMAPAGVLRPDDMPPGWGLLEVVGTRVRVVVDATHHVLADREGQRREIQLLVAAIRRHEAGVVFDGETGRFAPWVG